MSTDRTRTRPAARVGLVVASLAFTYVVLELVVFRFALPLLPLRLQVYLPEHARILAQSSKRSAVPHDYVALVGDSYAQGRGDWLLSADPNRNEPFASAHVIHERSGRDVISFGRGGAGSVGGLVVHPASSWNQLSASSLYRMPPPSVIVAYFYEGNDLEDTLMELLSLLLPNSKPKRRDVAPVGLRSVFQQMNRDQPDFFRLALEHPTLRDPRAFRELVYDRVPELLEPDRSLSDELLFARFVVSLFRGPPELPPNWGDITEPAGIPVRFGDHAARIPTGLQSPGLALRPAEIDLALYAYEQSLDMLSERFPNASICVTYVPSPLACYQLDGPRVSIQGLPERPTEFPSARVAEASDAIARRVGAIATDRAMRFVDARPALRDAARRESVHGPTDWRHFNRAGYHALADAALRCL